MRGHLILGTLGIAGLAGAVLTVAGVHSPVTGPLTLLFLLVGPGACIALLLPGLDAGGRAVVAGAAGLVLTGSIAEVMLVCSIWSLKGGVIAVAVVCAALIASAVVRGRRAGDVAAKPAPADEDALTAES